MTYPTFDPTFPARAVKALAEQADREALELAADSLSTSSYGFTLNGIVTAHSAIASLSTSTTNNISGVALNVQSISTGLSTTNNAVSSLSTNIQPLLTAYKQGVVGVATFAGSSQNISTTATPITFNPTAGTITAIPANTDIEVSALILRNIESAGTYGTASVFRESPLVQKQGNSREVMITISHTLSGSATGALTYEVRSVASNALVNQGTVIMTAKAKTIPITILFNTISDTASIASGYVLRFTTTTNVTVSLTRTRLIAIAK